jgi:hypothetical protein
VIIQSYVAAATAGFSSSIIKEADETITNDTTVSNDAELVVALQSGKTYLIDGQIYFASSSGADFKFNLQMTTGDVSTGLGIVVFVDSATASNEVIAGAAWNIGSTSWIASRLIPAFGALAIGCNDTANGFGLVEFSIVLTIGASGGNFAVVWAQDVMDGTNTTVAAGSWLRAREATP